MKGRRFESPDRTLVSVVLDEDNDDVRLGFEGHAGHTHADSLCFENFAGATTVESFLDALRQDRLIIAIARVEGTVRDVWVTDDPTQEQRRVGQRGDLGVPVLERQALAEALISAGVVGRSSGDP